MPRALSLAAMTLVAGGSAALLFELTRAWWGQAIAGTLAMGLGVAAAVYADRRWWRRPERGQAGPAVAAQTDVRRSPSPAREALEYGAATAVGWAIAQALLILL